MNREFVFPQEDDLCPRCRYGRIRSNPLPYIRIFRGHLFTVPDATCLTCDVCDYCEYEDPFIEIMGQMISAARSGVQEETLEVKPLSTPAASLLPDDSETQNSTQQVNQSQ